MHTEEEVDQANVVLELLLLDPEKTLSNMSTSFLLKYMFAAISMDIEQRALNLVGSVSINYLYSFIFSMQGVDKDWNFVMTF